MPRLMVSALLLVTVCGCHRAAQNASTPAPLPSSLAGDWALTELSGQPAPAGAGGRPATLGFDTDAMRAAGFAGCNRLSASYTITGNSLRFGAAAMTKMACAEGMELESAFANALTATTRFSLEGDELTLFAESGPVARFSRSEK